MLDLIKDISGVGSHPGGSEEEKKVAEYLRRSIENYCDNLVFDEFEYTDAKNIEKKSVNVIGDFENQADKRIIVCTNIDTIRDVDEVVNLWEKNIKDVSSVPYVEGANEPNSAIAFLIYFAKKISDMNLNKNLEIVGFGAQEEWDAKLNRDYKTNLSKRVRKKMKRLGYLMGSRHYVLSKGIENIDSVIAIDAVGIGTPKKVIRDSFGKSTLHYSLSGLENIKIRGFRYKPGKRTVEVIGCDHLPFRLAGTPSTWIIATKGKLTEKNFLGYILNHNNIPNYGTSQDTFRNLQRETSEKIIKRNFDLLATALIDFIKRR
ncbi:MAG: M28 family peptidase [Candidatus Thermoplasmatota archaeon]